MNQQDLLAIKQRFGIIGTNPNLHRAIEIAVQVARTDLSVLVTGESGVGKTEVARAIHKSLGGKKKSDDTIEVINAAAAIFGCVCQDVNLVVRN